MRTDVLRTDEVIEVWAIYNYLRVCGHSSSTSARLSLGYQ
ncbi:hypothetical protein M2272_000719 [Mycobacterium frederiksbergense]|uniref:Integrase n=1 Tax=Mycolicibacterium frederiksbergense TaxID=117567 RepID=A0ABT6KTQ7_9MYCO|nr:hypothetical protein [Mycolicibacterium frederiksbergense]